MIRRNTNDGSLLDFYQGGTLHGNINVSGGTVSISGATLHIGHNFWPMLNAQKSCVALF